MGWGYGYVLGCGSVCECVRMAVCLEILKWEENVITKFAGVWVWVGL